MTRVFVAVSLSSGVSDLARAEPPVIVDGLEVVHRVNPSTRDRTAERCVVTVEIGEDGVPTEAATFGCTGAFAAATTESILGWRWAPPTDGGAPARGRALVTVTRTGVRPSTAAPPPWPARCDHRLEVAPDGTIRKGPATGGPTCVSALPDRTTPPPVPVSCAIDVRVVNDERLLTLDRCPHVAHAWLEDVFDGLRLAPAAVNTLWVEATR